MQVTLDKLKHLFTPSAANLEFRTQGFGAFFPRGSRKGVPAQVGRQFSLRLSKVGSRQAHGPLLTMKGSVGRVARSS